MDALARALAFALLLTTASTTVTLVIIARTVGAMLIEQRTANKATAVTRADYLDSEQRQAAAMTMAATESRRLSALICAHLTQIGKLHKPCPAP